MLYSYIKLSRTGQTGYWTERKKEKEEFLERDKFVGYLTTLYQLQKLFSVELDERINMWCGLERRRK
jgi:hypothetical protein